MPYLGLDTSTRRLGVAVASKGRILARSLMEGPAPHSTTIIPAARMCLDAAGFRIADLDAIGVTSGPGRFTGLRVGMATAKGLALGLGVPVRGVSTLQVMAEALALAAAGKRAPRICALLEAGRGQLYRGVYKVGWETDRAWLTRLEGEEMLCDPGPALEGVTSPALVGGGGYLAFRKVIDETMPEGLTGWPSLPELAPVLAAGLEKMASKGALQEESPLLPNYIRPPDALQKIPR